MKPLVVRVGLIVGLLSLVYIGGKTAALFSDVETSTGNILAAGELDLKIDNTSYYNGASSVATTWQLDWMYFHCSP